MTDRSVPMENEYLYDRNAVYMCAIAKQPIN